MRHKLVEADGEILYIEDTPIVDISNQTIATIDTLVAEYSVPPQKVTAAGFMLPLPETTEGYNESIRKIYGYGASVLKIVSDKSLTFNGDELKFSSSKLGARATLLNFIMAQPQWLFAVPHLANLATTVPKVILEYQDQFEKTPLLRRTKVEGRDYVGLGKGIVLMDSRPEPSQKLSDALYQSGGTATAKTVNAYGPTSRFVNRTELETATKQNAVLKLSKVKEMNAETIHRIEQSGKSIVPNQLTILADGRITINGENFPYGNVALKILNRLLASYHAQPKTFEQIIAAETDPEEKKASEFILQHSHMGWFATATVEGRNLIGLKPIILTDRRSQ